VWVTGEASATSTIEFLELDRIDAEGRFIAALLFDPEDRAAAHQELFERWVASGADGTPAAFTEFLRALNAHDSDRALAALPSDYVQHDHRRTGVGRIEGARAYVASLQALWELSPDMRVDALRQLAIAPHGSVALTRGSGTSFEGGEWESFLLSVATFRGGKLVRMDNFEIEDLDAALARFEESRAGVRADPEA
jgi:hypothetical protein